MNNRDVFKMQGRLQRGDGVLFGRSDSNFRLSCFSSYLFFLILPLLWLLWDHNITVIIINSYLHYNIHAFLSSQAKPVYFDLSNLSDLSIEHTQIFIVIQPAQAEFYFSSLLTDTTSGGLSGRQCLDCLCFCLGQR